MKDILLVSTLCLITACSSSNNKRDASSQLLRDTLTSSAQRVYTTDTLLTTDTLSSWQDKIKEGIDFIAKGNEPFWSLEIDFDKAMYFKSLAGNDSLISPVPVANFAQDAQVTRYAATTVGGSLQVTLERRTCVDDMSGQPYPLYRGSCL